jgi:hypothetical protein
MAWRGSAAGEQSAACSLESGPAPEAARDEVMENVPDVPH